MINLVNYIDRPSQIHQLTGACKLVCLIAWSLAAMTSFYTPLLFICTTNPSEFAASLNRIGVSYKISYAVALALRYIPDIQ